MLDLTMSGQVHRCSAGETFDLAALLVYGDEIYAAELLCANPALCTTPVFTGGELLALPVIEIPDDTASPERMPATAPWKT